MWKISCLIAAAIAAIASLCLACGPFFPDAVLSHPDTALLAPAAECQRELQRISPREKAKVAPLPAPKKAEGAEAWADEPDPWRVTAQADLDELQDALQEAGTSPDERGQTLRKYSDLRKAISDYRDKLRQWQEGGVTTRPAADALELPTGLPAEFAQYTRGAIAYYRNDAAEARKQWAALLARPAKERPCRSTWAAFMLGRSWTKDDPAQARKYFALCRSLANEKFADSLHLAVASLGWEAKMHLDAREYPSAVELYLQQQAAGDTHAWESLRVAGLEMLNADAKTLASAAGDGGCRQVVTAVLISGGGPYTVETGLTDEKQPKASARWLSAIEKAGVKKVERADYVAWVAYQAGDFKAAKRWLVRAGEETGPGLWIAAKLELRAGRTKQAANLLAKAVKRFDRDEAWSQVPTLRTSDVFSDETEVYPRQAAAGELGCVLLSQAQYAQAMDVLLRQDLWPDAAYVAERLLTSDELLKYVRQNWPDAPDGKLLKEAQEGMDSASPAGNRTTWLPEAQRRHAQAVREADQASSIRHLLARRLTREGRWKDAREFYPPALQGKLDAYVKAIREGADKKRPTAARAASLFAAAKIARNDGMDLMGTEGEPDFFIWEGQYDYLWCTPAARIKVAKLLPPPADESRRYKASAAAIPKRFHYRYVAAAHAWAAAELLPDNSDQAAEILTAAGRWLGGRDAKAANKFYKALVRRCPKTDLGRQAKDIHWFPPETKQARTNDNG